MEPVTHTVIIETTFIYPGQQTSITYTAHKVPEDDLAMWPHMQVAAWTDTGGATYMVPFSNIQRITIVASVRP